VDHIDIGDRRNRRLDIQALNWPGGGFDIQLEGRIEQIIGLGSDPSLDAL
jgi:hypothetical protein